MKDSNIIVFRDGLFGDTLIAIPALIKLREIYSKSKIIYISIESKQFHPFKPQDAIDFTGIVDEFYHINRNKFFKIINWFFFLKYFLENFIIQNYL